MIFQLCKKCDRRRRCVKNGIRKYRHREAQQWQCGVCEARFTIRHDKFKNRCFSEEQIIRAISLTNLGSSLAEVRKEMGKELAKRKAEMMTEGVVLHRLLYKLPK